MGHAVLVAALMLAAPVLDGMVVDHLGRPVPGAIVRSGKLETKSDALGAYRLDLLRIGRKYLTVEAPNGAHGHLEGLWLERDATVKLTVQPAVRWRRTVLDKHGRRVPNAIVELRSGNKIVLSARADERGEVELTEPSSTWDIRFFAPDRKSWFHDPG